MNNEQLLQAISDMMDQKLEDKLDKKLDEKLDQKLEPIYIRLDKIENRLDNVENQYNSFYLEFKVFERNISKSVYKLQDEMETVIEILKLNELVPQ